jgi:hypothetical protein
MFSVDDVDVIQYSLPDDSPMPKDGRTAFLVIASLVRCARLLLRACMCRIIRSASSEMWRMQALVEFLSAVLKGEQP